MVWLVASCPRCSGRPSARCRRRVVVRRGARTLVLGPPSTRKPTRAGTGSGRCRNSGVAVRWREVLLHQRPCAPISLPKDQHGQNVKAAAGIPASQSRRDCSSCRLPSEPPERLLPNSGSRLNQWFAPSLSPASCRASLSTERASSGPAPPLDLFGRPFGIAFGQAAEAVEQWNRAVAEERRAGRAKE